MEITLNSKVKHIPSGDIITVAKINRVTFTGTSANKPYVKSVRVLKKDCYSYVELVTEKVGN